jgi:hypothetical protein
MAAPKLKHIANTMIAGSKFLKPGLPAPRQKKDDD